MVDFGMGIPYYPRSGMETQGRFLVDLTRLALKRRILAKGQFHLASRLRHPDKNPGESDVRGGDGGEGGGVGATGDGGIGGPADADFIPPGLQAGAVVQGTIRQSPVSLKWRTA